VVIGVAAVASAEAAPSLPPRTAEQLLTAVAQGPKAPLGPLTATVQETANLGLPALPAFAQQAGGPAGASTGPKSISIWYRDPRHIRVAEPVQAGETDQRLNGRTLWVWNSKTQTATRYTLPAHFSGVPANIGNGQSPLRRRYAFSPPAGTSIPDTPQAAAAQLLKAVGPTTVVSVQRNVYVAGRAAYQLSLVPRSSKSLVGSVLIAIDASRHIPLRVAVYARASSAPAYSIGFTALTFGTPAASNFSFTPPPGATVKHVTVPSNPLAAQRPAGLGNVPLGGLGLGPLGAILGAPAISSGSAGSSAPLVHVQKMGIAKPGALPALPKKAIAMIEAQFAKHLPKGMSAAQRAKAIKAFDQQLARSPSFQRIRALPGNIGGGFVNAGGAPIAAATANAPRVIGTSWLSVVATPPSPQVATAINQALTYNTLASSARPSSSSAYSSTLTTRFPAVPVPALLQALLKASTPVHGSWGSGRLLQTTLLNVLITSKGQILAGAVSPAVLYADVARDAG
jgi:outer membrane lipoprotein-sorting protein